MALWVQGLKELGLGVEVLMFRACDYCIRQGFGQLDT